MRRMKDFARGSSAPFARGLSTVYGWHDGDSSHRWACSWASSAAVRDDMSTCMHYRSCERGLSVMIALSDLLDDPWAVICGVHAVRCLVPIEGTYDGSWHGAPREGAMQTAYADSRER